MQLNGRGMTCAHCERAIQQAVATLGGTARVDLAQGTVEVTGLADSAATRQAIRQAIQAEGYTVDEAIDAAAAPASRACCRR
jgi:copper chaperone